ncbi:MULTISPECIES: hypothetical protein [Salinicola]|jgi:uncharacterized protein YjgD (DUF1641 family)|uniref:hypothetical protein n=1 Tax=Salinicola TaxID=404432 RepID=UPI000B3FAD79|nr:hypothetical protein [Salinicola salarius]|tara:strand:+ start:178 stop:669 length:492 start_codon:yes stop_codon:yes gene_type:complete
MAERIDYTPPPNGDLDPSAQQEWERLLEGLHEHGFLRFANDLVRSNTQLAQILTNALSREGSLNAIQNLSSLLIALSSIPPGQFHKTVYAARDAFVAMETEVRSEREHDKAPGFSGAFRLLKDEELWHALTPLIGGLKTFTERLDRDVERPVSDRTGKPSDFQ